MSFNVIIDVYRASNPTLYNTIKVGGYASKKKAIAEGQMMAKNEVKTQESLRGVKCNSRVIVTQDNTIPYR